MTFSIVARDPLTGAVGVATATAGPAVGALVPHGRAGRGAIATQAMTNPYLAYDGMEFLAKGDAQYALEQTLAGDPGADKRQLIIVDADGKTAAWTGAECQEYAGHRSAENLAVAGNLLTGPAVLDAMIAAFEGSDADTPLPERLLAALSAGADAGGDRRGVGSAAIKVCHRERYPAIDLRIDHSDKTIAALKQLLAFTSGGDYAQFMQQVPQRFGSSS